MPSSSREAVATEMRRTTASLERVRLVASYLDTPDRRLARQGLAWRLRREGRRWVQTLKAPGTNSLERLEHEALRPAAYFDPLAHQGTLAGERLREVLEDAQKDGIEVVERYRTDVQRTLRRVRTKGAVVELAFDEGRILADGAVLRLCELEFELISGSAEAMLRLAERWRKRFSLLVDPRTKAERGDRLASGDRHPPVRKAERPDYPRDAPPLVAFGAVLDECLDQILRNGIGLADGDPAQRVTHVHQMRVGIRRLRSALKTFEGWAPPPPEALVEGLRALFATLGESRDSDVLESGVGRSLQEAGAPPLAQPSHSEAASDATVASAAQTDRPDSVPQTNRRAARIETRAASARAAPADGPRAAVGSPEVQALLLAWLTWRITLADQQQAAMEELSDQANGGQETVSANSTAAPIEAHAAQVGQDGELTPDPAAAQPARETTVPDPAQQVEQPLAQRAEKRLRRWHRSIVADVRNFDSLDEEALHTLRKRVKRQRYAVEFLAAMLRRKSVAVYLKPLSAVQERMGELNDLFVARDHYRAHTPEPGATVDGAGAWFAMGWLAARIDQARAQAFPELLKLAKQHPPRA